MPSYAIEEEDGAEAEVTPIEEEASATTLAEMLGHRKRRAAARA